MRTSLLPSYTSVSAITYLFQLGGGCGRTLPPYPGPFTMKGAPFLSSETYVTGIFQLPQPPLLASATFICHYPTSQPFNYLLYFLLFLGRVGRDTFPFLLLGAWRLSSCPRSIARDVPSCFACLRQITRDTPFSSPPTP